MKRDGIDFQAAAATVTEGESGESGNKTRAPVKKPISHSPIKRGKPFEGGGGRGSDVKQSSDSPSKREKPAEVESGDEGSVNDSLLSRLLEYKVIRLPKFLI